MKVKFWHFLMSSVFLMIMFVTSAHAEYLGCFGDDSHHDLNGATWNSADLSTESCLKFCEDVGFSYAGTQSGTQCSCGNQYGSYGQSNDCNIPCAGDTNQICGGVGSNSVYSVDYTEDNSIFAPFAGKTWLFNSDRSYDEITFDATPTGETLFGLDTAGQLWGVDYNAEDGQYMVLLAEQIGNDTNAFSYRFSCQNCTSSTGQYLIIYSVGSSAQTIEGPFSANGQLVSSPNSQIETEALTLFAGETWIFDSERSHEEITFDPILSESGNLFGMDTKNELWLLAYRSQENEYILFTLRELNGKTDTFNYMFTCDTVYCDRVNGSYLIIYDFKGISETTDGTYSATGQMKSNTTIIPPPVQDNYPTLGNKAVDAFNNPISVNSTLNGGISVNGGAYLQRVEQRLSDSVDVLGTMMVDPLHVGSTVNIFVYAKVSLPSSDVYYMLNEQRDILEWDLNPTTLVPFKRNVPLAAVQTVPMYNGTFIYPGTLEIFFGYQLADGTLVSNSTPIFVTIY